VGVRHDTRRKLKQKKKGRHTVTASEGAAVRVPVARDGQASKSSESTQWVRGNTLTAPRAMA
jgi:hypothetical protein